MINQQSLLKIFKSSVFPTLIVSPGQECFTICEANDAALKISNKKEEDLIGEKIRDFFPAKNDLIQLIDSLRKVVKTCETEKLSMCNCDLTSKDQTRDAQFYEVHLVPVLTENKNVDYVVITIIDITGLISSNQNIEFDKNEIPAEVSKILINEGSDLVGIVDEAGEYKYLSPSFESILGYCPKDFLGANAFDYLHPEDKAIVSDDFLLLSNQKIVHAKPCRFRHKNGTWRWIETVLTNLITDPKVKGIVAVSRDITEWMKAEEERRISEEKYKMLFDFSPVPRWIFDLQTWEILDVNETAVQNYGYSREEFLTMTIADLRPKEDLPEFYEFFKNLNKNTNIVRTGVVTHLKKDGTSIQVNISGNIFNFKERECMMVVCTDITEKEIALQKLKESEEKLIAAVDIAKIGYWERDMKTGELFWSDEIFNLLSIDKEMHKPDFDLFLQLIHEDDRERFEVERQKSIEGVEEFDSEIRILQPKGEYKWIHEKGKVVRNEKGEPMTFEGTLQDITESKSLKLSLEESNQRYDYVNKATFDAIWDWNLISGDCFWGDGFSSFGYEAETLMTDKDFWNRHIHPDDRERINEDIRKAIESESSNWMNEYRFQKADLSYAHVLDRCIIIRNKNGMAVRMVGAIQDVSEKKLLQQLLDKANRLAKLGSWEIDVETKTVYWSDVVREIREADDDFIPTLEKGMIRFKDGEDQETIRRRVEECIKTGKPWREDLQIYTEKGNLKWIRTIGEAEMVNGKCVKISGSFQDIDSSKKAEMEIRELYEEKNTILESIGDGFIAVDKNWTITYWNNHAETMLKLPKSQAIGFHLWDLFAESIHSEFYDQYYNAIEKNEKVAFETYYQELDKWYEVSAFPSENGMSIYFKDVTERKLSHFKLKELHLDLQKTANDLATSNAELEQFAYIASHDLQEPLRMVTSFLSQLEKKYGDLIDEKGKKYIYFAVDGAKRMRQIILDLLEFSRVGRFDGKLESVNSNQLAEEVVSLFRTQVEETEARIEYKDLPVIQTFRSPFRQVLQNLISNALKYRRENQKPLIQICAVDIGTYWQFAVSDNGIGIDPEFFDKVFVIFQRLHNKDEYSGTGIGLAIVKKIIETLGGQIWIESKKGEGSTFFFTVVK